MICLTSSPCYVLSLLLCCLLLLQSSNALRWKTFTLRPSASSLAPLRATECPPADFNKVVLQSSKPVFVDFYADWCGPCKLMGPIFNELSKEYSADQLEFVKVDTEVLEETIETYNVQGLPMFGIFLGGTMVASHMGALPKEGLRKFLLDTLSKNNISI